MFPVLSLRISSFRLAYYLLKFSYVSFYYFRASLTVFSLSKSTFNFLVCLPPCRLYFGSNILCFSAFYILMHISRHSKWAPVTLQMYLSLLIVGPRIIPLSNMVPTSVILILFSFYEFSIIYNLRLSINFKVFVCIYIYKLIQIFI